MSYQVGDKRSLKDKFGETLEVMRGEEDSGQRLKKPSLNQKIS